MDYAHDVEQSLRNGVGSHLEGDLLLDRDIRVRDPDSPHTHGLTAMDVIPQPVTDKHTGPRLHTEQVSDPTSFEAFLAGWLK